MVDIDESTIVVETGEQKLKRLGKTEVISGADVNGATQVLGVNYAASTYKQQERYNITQENPEDVGDGYQFTNTNETEV